MSYGHISVVFDPSLSRLRCLNCDKTQVASKHIYTKTFCDLVVCVVPVVGRSTGTVPGLPGSPAVWRPLFDPERTLT